MSSIEYFSSSYATIIERYEISQHTYMQKLKYFLFFVFVLRKMKKKEEEKEKFYNLNLATMVCVCVCFVAMTCLIAIKSLMAFT